ncbi:MAG: phosphatidate cytidylyltransferase [Deltaproteobacteria bacterium]|nr:phosphatidate cytidylyltransferase [Deltaproteobacteria bacterium]
MMRWITGIFGGAGVIFVFLFCPKEWVQFGIVILSMLGLWEYFNLTQKGVSLFIRVTGVLFCGAGSFTLIFVAITPDHFLTLFAGLIILTFVLHMRGTEDWPARIKSMALFYFGIMYLSLLFSYWGWILNLENWKFWIFLLLGGTFLSDTGGYLFGRWFGKHKLAPHLSPGKTIEGVLGGWFVALIAAFAVRNIFWPDYPSTPLLVIGTLIAFIGPLGDLSESMIKRGVNVKDSGNLIPGHGGLLDRVDALLFTGPVVYYFAKYFS